MPARIAGAVHRFVALLAECRYAARRAVELQPPHASAGSRTSH
jgi:hypothetical protein